MLLLANEVHKHVSYMYKLTLLLVDKVHKQEPHHKWLRSMYFISH